MSGPDGFPLAVWHISYDFVNDEIMNLLKEFYDKGYFIKIRSLSRCTRLCSLDPLNYFLG